MQNKIKIALKKNKNFYKDFKKFFKKLKKDHFKKDLLKLHEPVFSKMSENIVKDCIDSTFVSPNGKYNKLFEKKIKDLTKSKYLVATSSGTAALHLACMAIDLSKGDTLVTTPITFVASANCAQYLGAKTLFVDIDNKSNCICPEQLKKLLKKKKIQY